MRRGSCHSYGGLNFWQWKGLMSYLMVAKRMHHQTRPKVLGLLVPAPRRQAPPLRAPCRVYPRRGRGGSGQLVWLVPRAHIIRCLHGLQSSKLVTIYMLAWYWDQHVLLLASVFTCSHLWHVRHLVVTDDAHTTHLPRLLSFSFTLVKPRPGTALAFP
jgi:hypothetical protein